ncbi:hypothetical protein ACOSP6_09760 [Tenacibaculum sp. MEBiC06402]|uniref:hypothetical protein n=1 Tax=unclassified Tenacibaculum TaxID=2635139 RepID=UPI003B9B58F0
MRKITIYCLLALLSLVLKSCVDNIDFSQAEDFELTPEVAVSLINATVTQNELVVGGSEVGTITQTSVVTVLDNEIAQNDLNRVVFRFEISNQFNRDFRINFSFLDGNDTSTNNDITLNVNANNTNFVHEEDIIIADNPTFLNTRKVEVELTLLPSSDGSSIDINVPTSFIFKSAGTFYFTVNNN